MKTAADVIATLQALQAKKSWTWSDLSAPQAELDAIDAARYVPGAPPASDEDVEAIDTAYDLLATLMDGASDVADVLNEPIARLLDARSRAIKLLAVKNHTSEEVAALQAVLDDVSQHERDGVYYGTPADAPAGQAYISELVADLADRTHALLETASPMAEGVAKIYHALDGHHRHLAALARKPVAELKNSVNEVARVQGMLQDIDSARSASTGAFAPGADGSVPPGQAAAAALLERNFALAHKILMRVEKAEAGPAK